jgi:hypothetical protein
MKYTSYLYDIKIKVMSGNNKKKIYRIAKGGFPGTGPYGYLRHKLYEQEGKTENDPSIKLMKKVLVLKERWSDIKFESGDTIKEKIERYPIFSEQGCFSTFKTQRPGPFDDPLLKQNIRNRFGSRENLINGVKVKRHFFAFDSKEQMHKWFDDPEELAILRENGFDIFEERAKVKDIVFGLKQIWVLEQ